MQVPMVATFKHSHGADVREPIRCAAVFRPTPAEQHQRELVRYIVLLVALLAVGLLIAIALYYTAGNSVTVKHVSALAPHLPLFS